MSKTDPLWQLPRAHLERKFHVLGFDLRFSTNSAAGLAIAARAFGRGKECCQRGDEIRLEFILRDDLPQNDPAAPDRTPVAEYYRERGGLYLAATPQGESVVADLEGMRIHAFAHAAGRPDLQQRMLIESPVWRIAAQAGLTALHAATAIVDGVTLVLRGPSGSGKSTLMAAHAQTASIGAGLLGDRDGRGPNNAVVSEEISWIDLSGPRPKIRGMPWITRLDRQAIEFLGLGRSTSEQNLRADQKVEVDLEALACACIESTRPGPVVFLARRSQGADLDHEPSLQHAPVAARQNSSHSSWRSGNDWPHAAPWGKLSPAQTLEWMLESLETPERTQRAAQLETAARLLAGHGGYWLEVTEPAETIAQLRHIAAEHRGSSPSTSTSKREGA